MGLERSAPLYMSVFTLSGGCSPCVTPRFSSRLFLVRSRTLSQPPIRSLSYRAVPLPQFVVEKVSFVLCTRTPPEERSH